MPLSNKWNMTDNIYHRQPSYAPVKPKGVDQFVFDFAQKNSKRETYLYNNRLFFGIVNPTQKDKDRYNANWEYINTL